MTSINHHKPAITNKDPYMKSLLYNGLVDNPVLQDLINANIRVEYIPLDGVGCTKTDDRIILTVPGSSNSKDQTRCYAPFGDLLTADVHKNEIVLYYKNPITGKCMADCIEIGNLAHHTARTIHYDTEHEIVGISASGGQIVITDASGDVRFADRAKNYIADENKICITATTFIGNKQHGFGRSMIGKSIEGDYTLYKSPSKELYGASFTPNRDSIYCCALDHVTGVRDHINAFTVKCDQLGSTYELLNVIALMTADNKTILSKMDTDVDRIIHASSDIMYRSCTIKHDKETRVYVVDKKSDRVILNIAVPKDFHVFKVLLTTDGAYLLIDDVNSSYMIVRDNTIMHTVHMDTPLSRSEKSILIHRTSAGAYIIERKTDEVTKDDAVEEQFDDEQFGDQNKTKV